MATALLRPNDDVANAWTITDGGATEAWQVLDDAVTQPTAPSNASDFISSATAGQVCEMHVATQAASVVTGAKLWFYSATALLDNGHTAKIFKGATELATFDVGSNSAAQWRSVAFDGALTQAETDDLRIKFIHNGAGGTSEIYAAYIDLTYLPAGKTALRPNTDTLQQMSIVDGGATGAWQVLDDIVLTEQTPSTGGDYMESDDLESLEVGVGTVTVGSVTEAKLHFYAFTGTTSAGFTARLRHGTTDLGSLVVGGNSAAAWRTITYTGSLTQAQVDDLRCRFEAGNSLDIERYYACYVELTYTEPAPAATGRPSVPKVPGVPSVPSR